MISSFYLFLLKDLAEKYIDNIDEKMSIADICNTVNVGRKHNNYRLAFAVKSIEELKEKLAKFLEGNKSLEDDYFYGFSKLVSSKKKKLNTYELNETKKNEIDAKANNLISDIMQNQNEDILNEICKLYIRGADIAWYKFYLNESVRKISLPTYQFKKDRCWLDDEKTLINGQKIQSIGQTIYITNFSPINDWVIGDHLIYNKYVMPGTAYIEMVVEALKEMGITSSIEFKNTMFINQFSMDYEENKELQLILKEKEQQYEFTIASYDEEESKWNIHCEGVVSSINDQETSNIDLAQIQAYIKKENFIEIDSKDRLVNLEGRWEGIKKDIYKTENGYLAYIELSHEHIEDIQNQYFHPALLDRSINATIDIIDINENYLPLNYSKLKMYRHLPAKFYSVIGEKHRNGNETATYDVKLIDLEGNLLVEAIDYSVKKARVSVLKNNIYKNRIFCTEWEKFNEEDKILNKLNGEIALIRFNREEKLNVIEEIESKEIKVTEIDLRENDAYIYNSFDKLYMKDYSEVMEFFKENNIKNIVFVDEGRSEVDLQCVFLLVREIVRKKMSKEIKVLFIAKNECDLRDKQINISPFNNAIASLIKVIGQEYEDLECRFINTEEPITLDFVSDELKKTWKKTVVAYKNNEYYHRALKRYNGIHEKIEDYRLYNHGAYVITGASGGIALEIAKHLAFKKNLNIILISRSNIGGKNDLDKVLESNENYKTSRLIKSIKDIEKMGSNVEFYSCDVSDKDKLDNLINKVRSEFGRINGIIHCAGVAGDGFLFKKSKDEFNNVVMPKIKGTVNLDLLTRVDKPDFMVLFSSINSILGGKGQGDYSAANAFMDGYSIFRNNLGLNTIAINWTAWKDTGMAYDYNSYKEDDLFNSLDIEDGLNLFDIAIKGNMSNVVIGEINFNFFKSNDTERLPLEIEASIIEKFKNRNIKNKVVKQDNYSELVIVDNDGEELTDIEKGLAKVWSKVLKTNKLNIYDSFSSLGGDSILATYLYKELEKKYPGIFDITDIFNYSSIYEMANRINEVMKKDDIEEISEEVNESQADDLDNLLAMLANGEIDVNEINKILG